MWVTYSNVERGGRKESGVCTSGMWVTYSTRLSEEPSHDGVCTSGMWVTYSAAFLYPTNTLRCMYIGNVGNIQQTDDSIIKWKVDSSD